MVSSIVEFVLGSVMRISLLSDLRAGYERQTSSSVPFLRDRKIELKYNLRQRRHEFSLIQKIGHLADCNFIARLLCKDIDMTRL